MQIQIDTKNALQTEVEEQKGNDNNKTRIENVLRILRSSGTAVSEQDRNACIFMLESVLQSEALGESHTNNNSNFNLLPFIHRLPKNVQNRLNENGAIYFDSRDTLASKLFGWRANEMIWKTLIVSFPRIATFNVILLIVSVLAILGMFVVVQKEVFLLSITISICYLLFVFLVFLDFEIVKLIVMYDSKFSLNIVLTFLYGWSVGVILDWDYRAVPMFLLTVTSTVHAGLTDAFEMNTRRAQVVVNIVMYFLATVGLLIGFNFGYIPGTIGGETKTLVVFTALDRSIPYTAYAGLNTALLALLGLSFEELWKRYLWRKTDRLRTLSIPLVGVNRFTFVDTSYLEAYMSRKTGS